MKQAFALLLFCICISSGLYAQNPDPDRRLGFGAALQTQNNTRGITPTGISIRAVLGSHVAINGVTAFTLGPDANSLYLQGDIILSDTIEDEDFEEELERIAPLNPYFGVGLRTLVGNGDNLLGIRLPVGLRFDVPDVPVDVFIEIAPTFDIDPRFLFSFGGGLGFRYYPF